VDAVLKGGDGGAGEFHEITTKLLEVTAWLEKERGGSPVEEEVEKADCSRASGYK
jgi:hypothetical protein